MIEQGIHGRSEEAFYKENGEVVFMGHGWLAVSEGFSNISSDLDTMMGDYPAKLADAQGDFPYVFRKYLLNTHKERHLQILQQATRIQIGHERPYCLWHLYAATTKESEREMMRYPLDWISVPFQSVDANWRRVFVSSSEYLPVRENYPLEEMRYILSDFKMDINTLEDILCCLLDAVKTGRSRVIILFDDGIPDYEQLVRQMLVYIYLFLPMSVRSCLGFETWMTGSMGAERCQLLFASQRFVQQIGDRRYIYVNNPDIWLDIGQVTVDVTEDYLFLGNNAYYSAEQLPDFASYRAFIRPWLNRAMDEDLCAEELGRLNIEYWIPFEDTLAEQSMDFYALDCLRKIQEGGFEWNWANFASFGIDFLSGLGKVGENALIGLISALEMPDDEKAEEALRTLWEQIPELADVRQALAKRLADYYRAHPISIRHVGVLMHMIAQNMIENDPSIWLHTLNRLTDGNMDEIRNVLYLAAGRIEENNDRIIAETVRRQALDTAIRILPHKMSWRQIKQEILGMIKGLDENESDRFIGALINRSAIQSIEDSADMILTLSKAYCGSHVVQALFDHLNQWKAEKLSYAEVLSLAKLTGCSEVNDRIIDQIIWLTTRYLESQTIEQKDLPRMQQLIHSLRRDFQMNCFQQLLQRTIPQDQDYFVAIQQYIDLDIVEESAADCLNQRLCEVLNELSLNTEALWKIGEITRGGDSKRLAAALRMAVDQVTLNGIEDISQLLHWSKAHQLEALAVYRLCTDASGGQYTIAQTDQVSRLLVQESMEDACRQLIGAAKPSDGEFTIRLLCQWCSDDAIPDSCVEALADIIWRQPNGINVSISEVITLVQAAAKKRLLLREGELVSLIEHMTVEQLRPRIALDYCYSLLRWIGNEHEDMLLKRIDCLLQELTYAISDVRDAWGFLGIRPTDGQIRCLRLQLNQLRPDSPEQREVYVRTALRYFGDCAPECIIKLMNSEKCLSDFGSVYELIRAQTEPRHHGALFISALGAMLPIQPSRAKQHIEYMDSLMGISEDLDVAAQAKCRELFDLLALDALVYWVDHMKSDLLRWAVLTALRKQLTAVEQPIDCIMSNAELLNLYTKLPEWYEASPDSVELMQHRILSLLSANEPNILNRLLKLIYAEQNAAMQQAIFQTIGHLLNSEGMIISQTPEEVTATWKFFTAMAPELIPTWLHRVAESNILVDDDSMADKLEWMNELLIQPPTANGAKACFCSNIILRMTRSIQSTRTFEFERLLSICNQISDEQKRYIVMAECVLMFNDHALVDMLLDNVRQYWSGVCTEKKQRMVKNRRTFMLLLALFRAAESRNNLQLSAAVTSLLSAEIYKKSAALVLDMFSQLEEDIFGDRTEVQTFLKRMLRADDIDGLISMIQNSLPTSAFQYKGSRKWFVAQVFDADQMSKAQEILSAMNDFAELGQIHLFVRLQVVARVIMQSLFCSDYFVSQRSMADYLQIEWTESVFDGWKRLCGAHQEIGAAGFHLLCREYAQLLAQMDRRKILLDTVPQLADAPKAWLSADDASEESLIGAIAIGTLNALKNRERKVSVNTYLMERFGHDVWSIIRKHYWQGSNLACRHMSLYCQRSGKDVPGRSTLIHNFFIYALTFPNEQAAKDLISLAVEEGLSKPLEYLLDWRGKKDGEAVEGFVAKMDQYISQWAGRCMRADPKMTAYLKRYTEMYCTINLQNKQ